MDETAGERGLSRRTRTRARLLAGLGAAVVEHGLREATVAQIVEAARLSRRTLYLHFDGKDEAIMALYQDTVAALVEAVDRAIRDTAEPAQRVFAEVDAYLEFQQRGGALVALLQAEAANPASCLYPLRSRTMDRLVDLASADVRRELGHTLDPMVYRCLFAGFEEIVSCLRDDDGTLSDGARARAATIMKRMVLTVLASAADMPHAP